jgi:hypothetical protein
MGPRRTRGQHRTACAHDPAFVPRTRPSAPHLSRATRASSRMRGGVCRVACERWGTRDDARGRAHTPFPARVCDRGLQRARAQGGAIGRHARSEGSARTPLLYPREGVHTPPRLPFVGTGGTVPAPVHPRVRLCAGCATPHLARAPARSPGCATPTHRISPVPPALRAQTKPGCRRDRCTPPLRPRLPGCTISACARGMGAAPLDLDKKNYSFCKLY